MSSTALFGDFANHVNDASYTFNFGQLALPLIAFVFSYIIAYALITVASLSYIKSYIENKGIVNYQDIQTLTKDKFWPYVSLFILIGLIVGVGLLFFVIPGIYFGVVLSLTICLLIFENKGVFDSVNDSFILIRDHWWETFGILLVIQILIGVISYLVDLPATLYQGLDLVSVLQNPDSVDLFSSFTDPIYLALAALSYFIKFILYTISTVATVFIYYDIKEQKNPSADIINQIGLD